jgi:phosphoglycerol transferase
MSNAVSLGAAVLLLSGSWALAFLGRRSRALAMLLGVLVFAFFVLSSMFLAANRFTGHGIDQAVLFHVRYGLEGAGFSEYSLLIAGTLLLLLLGGSTAVFSSLFLTRSRPRARPLPTGRASLALALLACTVNPASRDLAQLFGSTRLMAILGGSSSPPPSDFYQHYRRPTLGADPASRRNLVFIYAEGFERTYLDPALFPGLAVGLTRLEQAATSYTNIGQTPGTSFTIGGMVGSQCGIPLVTSSDGNSMSGMSRFLPNAVCIGDLLQSRGYHLAYLGGASLRFAGKGKFLSAHGFSDLQGKEELLARQADPSYRSTWGVYDDVMLDAAYDKFVELSSGPKNFALFLLTLDTHGPDGYLSKPVQNVRYENGDTAMLNAVAGSDRLISAFIERLRASPHADDTVIVLSSDHLAMANGASDRLSAGERRNLFMVFDPAQPGGQRIEKPGLTLDVGPTVLAALGYPAKLGLGRNLASPELSLTEALPDLISKLADWRQELSGFWGVSRLTDVVVRAAEQELDAGGTTIGLPALITFDDDLNAELFFEFGNSTRLPEYLVEMQPGTSFLFVADCERVRGYADVAGPRGDEPALCALAGKRGAEPIVREYVASRLEISEEQLRAVLDSPLDATLYTAQTERIGEGELPDGFVELVASLPRGAVFFAPKSRLSRYIARHAQRPEVVARELVWTEQLPAHSEFYFAASSLRQVKKSEAYSWERLPSGPDLLTILKEHEQDVVILSSKGDARLRLSPDTLRYLATRGVDLRRWKVRGSFAVVLEGPAPLALAIDNEAPVVLTSAALALRGIDRVESAGKRLGNYSRIILGGKQASPDRRGINLVILPRSGERSALNIDTYFSERRRSDIYLARPRENAVGPVDSAAAIGASAPTSPPAR